MSVTSGRGLPVPLGFYDPESRSLRMSQGTFDSDSTSSSVTLPSSGSMLSGTLYARRRSALPTNGAASSSSPLLKTPTANLAVNGGSQHPDKRKQGGHGPTLADEVEHLLPTPLVADARDTANYRPDGTPYGSGCGMTLTDASRLLLPTPRASDGAKGGPNQRGSKGDLALPAVAHRIGGGSVPPSAAGSTPPDDEPHGQLTIEIG